MAKNLSRISELKIAADTLNTITKAQRTIKKETGISWSSHPDKAIEAANKKIEELKKE